MKTIYRIISIILITYLSSNLLGDEKSKDKPSESPNPGVGAGRDLAQGGTKGEKSTKGTNQISRTEQKMQGLGKLELVIQNGHNAAVNGILLTKDEKKMISYSADNTIKIWDMQEQKLLKTLEGHTGSVKGILITKDEKKLISYSLDETVKIWDLENRKLIKTLEGHTSYIGGIQLIANEKKLISYSDYGIIKIYDVENGILIKTLEGHTESVKGIKLTKNEKKLFSYSEDNTIKIWDLHEMKLLKTLKGHSGFINGIQLTKDEKKLIAYSRDKTVKIWDTEQGTLLNTLEGHTSEVNGILLTQDEKRMISYSNDMTIKIWDMANGKLLKILEGHTDKIKSIQLTKDAKKLISYSDDLTIKIWNMDNGKLLKTMEGYTGAINIIQLTIDERKVISYSLYNTIKIWDIENGKLLKNLEGHTESVKGIQLTKYEKKVISYSDDGSIKIWNVWNGKLLNTFEGRTEIISGMQLTKEEKKIFIFDWHGNTNTIRMWDRQTGKLLKVFEGHTDAVNGIQLTKNEKKLISYSNDNTIKIWDLDAGKLFTSLVGHTSSVSGIEFTNDEKKLISYSNDKTMKIWDWENGTLFRSLEGDGQTPSTILITKDGRRVISEIGSLSNNDIIQIKDLMDGNLLKILKGYMAKLTNDGKKLIYCSYDNTIIIWDLDAGKLITSLEGHTGYINVIQFSGDEKKLVSYSWDKTIKIWDIEKGKLIKTFNGNIDFIKTIQFTKDESKLISTSSDNTIKIWDIESGKCLQTLNHNSSNILQVIFNESPTNPNLLLSISSDGSLRYWNIETGKLLVTQLLFKNGHSIYYTPDGYFDFTDKSALEFISFVSPKIQNNFVDLQDLMNDYYVDGLLELVTNNKFKPNKKNNLTKGVETTSVVKALFETQESAPSSEDNKTLSFQITERGSKFEKAVVYVNGIQVDEKTLVEGENVEGVKLEDDSKEGYFKYRVKFAVPLNYGTNRVEVKAYNEYHIPQSFPAFEIQRKIPDNKELAKPDLYILSVGVNDYKTKKLTYSVPDAKAMAEALEQGKSGIYREVHTRLLVDAKKKEIEDAFLEIEKKARPQDIVLVYFSGHGMNAFTREGKKLFYFVPQDFNWPDDPENENVARMQGIDADYLNETFTKIKSHKLILILDSCHSGSVNVSLASRGQDKEKATRKAMEKMANGTGRFIFASSSGNEESREHKDVGHGLYTYVLLNALGKSKDKNITDADSINKDGFIYLSEIRSYIEQQFEEQTAKYLKGVIQTPPSMSLGRNGMHERVNDFPLVKSK